MQKKNILILGGGFAGIYSALSILKECGDAVDVTIVNRTNYFLFTPMLHEVATGGLGHHQVVESIREIVYRKRIRFFEASVESVDSALKEVRTDHGVLSYDMLVIALGASTNFFDTPGASEHAFVLKDLSDAIKVRDHVIERFETASRERDAAVRERLLTFVVVGGGATGVEYATELAEFAEHTLYKYYKRQCAHTKATITLVHAGAELLAPFSPRTRARALTSLSKKGVRVLLSTKVSAVDADGVTLSTGERIVSDTVVWTAGVQPNPLTTHGGELATDATGRIMTDATLAVSSHAGIFAVGDIAHVPNQDGKPYPMLAQIATAQAVHLGGNIHRAILGEPLAPFRFKERGLLVSLGKWEAAGTIAGIDIHGKFAWFIWRTVYLFKFISKSKRLKIAMDWTVGLFFSRDITRA